MVITKVAIDAGYSCIPIVPESEGEERGHFFDIMALRVGIY